jgi:sec-independent protein translocase protein TatA
MENIMFGLGMTELLVILAIVLLIFGPKRLKNIGSDLGNAIKGFRTAVTEEEEAKPAAEERVIEGDPPSAAQSSAAQSSAQSSEVHQDSKI